MQENKITKPKQKHMNIRLQGYYFTVIFDGDLNKFITKHSKELDANHYLVFKDILGHAHHIRKIDILDYEIYN